MEENLTCSENGCQTVALWSDGKDQWCIIHQPSKEMMEEFDIRPINHHN